MCPDYILIRIVQLRQKKIEDMSLATDEKTTDQIKLLYAVTQSKICFS